MSPSRSAVPHGESEAPEAALLRLYGHSRFRRLQRPIVLAMLADRDVIAVLPTGAGKSICFQLPALMRPDLTLVVSPLISLMQDQVAGLRLRGLAAADLSSATPVAARRRAVDALASREIRLLYASPEMLSSPGFRSLCKSSPPGRIVVDEAHCISEWGHDFRPSYRRIGDFARAVGRPPLAAFTATATPATRSDVEDCLGLRSPLRVVASVDRPNLHWVAARVRSLPEAIDRAGTAVLESLRSRPGTGAIVYAPTRRTAAHAAEALRRLGIRASYYHAGLDADGRRHVQDRFLAGDLSVVCATSAFGMGIDHPRIRLVCHCGMPGALESYVQEAGRAGRDGERAVALLLATPRDRRIHALLARGSGRGPAHRRRARARLRAMMGYVSTSGCRRSYISSYFGERPPACSGCDRCYATGQPLPWVRRLRFDMRRDGRPPAGSTDTEEP